MAVLVADIGGTHARFAISELDASGIQLSQMIQFPVSRFDNLADCLKQYRDDCETVLPKHAIFAVAAPTGQGNIAFTNSGWNFNPSEMKNMFDFDDIDCINDFVAVAHAVINAKSSELLLLHGPQPEHGCEGVTTVIGPGTGLGVSYILKTAGYCHTQETEASHIGFSPTDDFEALLYKRLKNRFDRVSAERVASGAGLREICNQLTDQQSFDPTQLSDTQLWNQCLKGSDTLSKEAMARFCGILGSIAGDMVLAQGATRLVLAGSIARKLIDIIPQTDFHARLMAKGRFGDLMSNVPIQFLDCDQSGLMGAAYSAFAPSQNKPGVRAQ